MTTNDKPVAVDLVACEICLKEVPKDDAINPETEDYVANFCGLECYELWKKQGVKPDDPGK